MPTSGDTVTIPGGPLNSATLTNATLTGETITLDDSSGDAPTVHFNDVTLGVGSALQSAGPSWPGLSRP